MPLPQQVIDRLSKEPPKTPGWSFGLLTFSAGIFFITILVYLGLSFGYEPYVQGQIDAANTQITTLIKSISPDDQARVITFYSQITNIQNALAKHVTFSRFLSWLETNTEQNVYFSRTSLNVDSNQVSLTGVAKNESDVNQQIAIFEASPAVKSVSVSQVSLSDTTGLWGFAVSLTVDPAAVLRVPPGTAPVAPAAPSATAPSSTSPKP